MANPSIQVVLIGNNRVGRTSLLVTYIEDKFPSAAPYAAERRLVKSHVDGRVVTIWLWDPQGGVSPWHDDVIKFSASLFLGDVNPPVTIGLLSQTTCNQELWYFRRWTSCTTNSRVAGGIKRTIWFLYCYGRYCVRRSVSPKYRRIRADRS